MTTALEGVGVQLNFTPGKNPLPILQEGGWAPGLVWMGRKSCPHWGSIPDGPACSQSLYQLSYLAHIYCLLLWRNTVGGHVKSLDPGSFVCSVLNCLVPICCTDLYWIVYLRNHHYEDELSALMCCLETSDILCCLIVVRNIVIIVVNAHQLLMQFVGYWYVQGKFDFVLWFANFLMLILHYRCCCHLHLFHSVMQGIFSIILG